MVFARDASQLVLNWETFWGAGIAVEGPSAHRRLFCQLGERTRTRRSSSKKESQTTEPVLELAVSGNKEVQITTHSSVRKLHRMKMKTFFEISKLVDETKVELQELLRAMGWTDSSSFLYTILDFKAPEKDNLYKAALNLHPLGT